MILSLLKMLSAYATVNDALDNILKLTLRFGITPLDLYSAKAFNSSIAPSVFPQNWHCEALLCD